MILVTGGGTGGHVYPALALAEELRRRGREVRFVGSARGMEAQAVPAAGFPVDLLPGRGLQRRLTLQNFEALWGALVAFVKAWRIVGRTRPRVVVGVGGYASLPCVVAAWLRRVPVVVHEQNAAPGLANRVAVRLGARPAVSLPGTPLRGAVLVGNPVRAAIVAVERRPDPERPLVLAFGGSLGSRTVNEAVAGLARIWTGRIHHVTGRRDEGRYEPAGPHHTVVAYEERMEERYAEASVAVARAGAVTVAELAAAGVPSVLVPLPGAPGDHQTRNAMALVEAGAAVLVPDAECTPERLAAELEPLLADPARLDAMSAAAKGLARPSAASDLADLVEAAAG